MNELLQRLKAKERRGSKPRCHLLTHGLADEVAARLTELAAPFGFVSPSDPWMPHGFEELEEAQLHKAPRLLDAKIGAQLGMWWLESESQRGRTPNFDIASTCTIDGAQGLLLVEAKAHDEELNKEVAGRNLTADASEDRKTSHVSIERAIRSAGEGLERETMLPWRIGRDSHYQMSNRFAWSWKLTTLRIPVILVYLGFLNAEEMNDRGNPFTDHADWERLVIAHSQQLFPSDVWNRRWMLNGVPFAPLIRTTRQALDLEVRS